MTATAETAVRAAAIVQFMCSLGAIPCTPPRLLIHPTQPRKPDLSAKAASCQSRCSTFHTRGCPEWTISMFK